MIPIVTAHAVPILILVPVYSPAFIDADTFHQRIAVEALWDGCLMALLPLLLGNILCFAVLGVRHMAGSLPGGRRA